MSTKVNRRTVDLSQYPGLVVIYLGMRVNRTTGLKTLLGFGPKISASVDAQPEGLLVHEPIFYSMFPPHVGMRQYWRDIESLLAWTRSDPHREWWKAFLKDSGGTGFWHETYLMQGGMEAIYDDVAQPIGFLRFAPAVQARGAMFGAASRAHGQYAAAPVLTETELYGGDR
jgi:fumigallin biosynthesis monooxygenase-like protein